MICSLTSIPITALSSKLRQDIDSGPFIDEHKIFGNTTYSPVNQQFTYINHLAQWITKIEMFYHSDWKLYHGDLLWNYTIITKCNLHTMVMYPWKNGDVPVRKLWDLLPGTASADEFAELEVPKTKKGNGRRYGHGMLSTLS